MPPTYGQQRPGPSGPPAPSGPSQQQWPPASGVPYGGPPVGTGASRGQQVGGYEEPEYFGDPYQQPGPGPQNDPYANSPGHTQVFSVNEEPYSDGVRYRAASTLAVPTGPRLGWRDLLSGIVFRPHQTFLQMRDYTVWRPALIVTGIYGLVALFGFNAARDDATFSNAVPYAVITAITFIIGGLILGAVTDTVARQLGGDGSWQPTVGLSMLIMSITDAPRLLFALILGGDNGLVQALGWITWLGAVALFTIMVSKSHDLLWPKALGASAIELIALLSLVKLGTF